MKNHELKRISYMAREDIIKMLAESKSGHTAGPLGMAEIFTVLYYNHAKIDSKKPEWAERDYIYLSNGHICAIWYTTLANLGFFPKDHLMSFRKINSLLQGHPHNETTPGVENSGGPLAQGLSQSVGCALAFQRDGKPNKVYCLCSDGEHEEGQAWEAIMFAAHYKLDNLTFIMDRNNIQIDGYTTDIMDLEPLADKFTAFNWHVIEIDGHDVKAIKKALEKADSNKGKPTVILAKTVPGKGVSFMEGTCEWHGKPPNEEEAHKALKELSKHTKEKKGWKRW